ncbi:hypothetical protein [Flavobacterium alkalisoli]|uniref:hypothetical protein n=1 Tax=Flavobacterium alkalisoli TaxID=2602769 RepID=UPI003A916E4E
MSFKHGLYKSPEYKVWTEMKRRCHKETASGYERYGGRGISVCDRWKDSFSAFYEDMGPRPSVNHSIDRMDNDGNYEPSNCRWATNSEQMKNRGKINQIGQRKMSSSLVVLARKMYAKGKSSYSIMNELNIDVSDNTFKQMLTGKTYQNVGGPIVLKSLSAPL